MDKTYFILLLIEVMFLLLRIHDDGSFLPKHVCLTVYVTLLLNHKRISNEVNGTVIIFVLGK
jgi:hypothetical protein